jgi:hypothetical protein
MFHFLSRACISPGGRPIYCYLHSSSTAVLNAMSTMSGPRARGAAAALVAMYTGHDPMVIYIHTATVAASGLRRGSKF